MNIITYIPEPHWLVTEILRPAAYGALAGIIIKLLMGGIQ